MSGPVWISCQIFWLPFEIKHWLLSKKSIHALPKVKESSVTTWIEFDKSHPFVRSIIVHVQLFTRKLMASSKNDWFRLERKLYWYSDDPSLSEKSRKDSEDFQKLPFGLKHFRSWVSWSTSKQHSFAMHFWIDSILSPFLVRQSSRFERSILHVPLTSAKQYVKQCKWSLRWKYTTFERFL